jgi:hypothetical protein
MTLLGVDYAGGRPSPTSLRANGVTFVCRYLSDGGPSLPGKQLLSAEAAALKSAGIEIVSNWETSATSAFGGFNAGVADAHVADAAHTAVGGPATRPIYFSCDWDETPDQAPTVAAYFQGVASVIGLSRAGVYGGFWTVSRLLDAGLVSYAWQTQAWSGGQQDPRVAILQDNNAGYLTIDSVQCDVDRALVADYGQWSYQSTPGPGPGPAPVFAALTPAQQNDMYNKVNLIFQQLVGPSGDFKGWPQDGGRTLNDTVAAIAAKVGVPGTTDPESVQK